MRTAVIGLSLAFFLLSCDRPPSVELREWSAADHDRMEEKAKSRQGAQQRGGNDDTQVIELTWQAQCARCHGPVGKGDGPDGPMVKARDLTSEELQAQMSDAEMMKVIREGKGQMPKFPGIPQKVLEGLVARIRATRGFTGAAPQ